MKRFDIDERHTLCELQTRDAGDIFLAIDTQRRYLGRWLPFVQYTRTPADSQAFVRSVLEALPYEYVFTIRRDDRFAGLIGFKSTDATLRRSEIGYWLREEQQGRGLVSRAVVRLCRFAAEELGLGSVLIRCAVGNGPSNRVPQRLGFEWVRTEEHAELLEDGTWTACNVWEADPASIAAACGLRDRLRL